jgi:cytochrome c556
MRRFLSGVCVLGVLWATAAVTGAQVKPRLEDVNRIMKKAGPVQQTLVKALLAGDQATAKAQVAVLKSGIVDAQPFWSANKRADATEISKTVVSKIDALQKSIESPSFDSKVALAAVQDLNKTCNECHKVYRSTDEDGHYMLKPGSIPGY